MSKDISRRMALRWTGVSLVSLSGVAWELHVLLAEPDGKYTITVANNIKIKVENNQALRTLLRKEEVHKQNNDLSRMLDVTPPEHGALRKRVAEISRKVENTHQSAPDAKDGITYLLVRHAMRHAIGKKDSRAVSILQSGFSDTDWRKRNNPLIRAFAVEMSNFAYECGKSDMEILFRARPKEPSRRVAPLRPSSRTMG